MFGLKEKVPVTILNELSRKIYEDSAHHVWDPSKLPGAVCIRLDQAKLILDPFSRLDSAHLSDRQLKKESLKMLKEWNKKPLQDKTVFSISYPEFTDDNRYAVVDVVMQCDSKGCGTGRTYIFRRTESAWEIAGERTAWSN